jgi:hypothetical protein
VDDEAAMRVRIPARLREAGIGAEHLTRIVPSLEDVFAQYVRREGGAVAG